MAKEMPSVRDTVIMIAYVGALPTVQILTGRLPEYGPGADELRVLMSLAIVGLYLGILLAFDNESPFCEKPQPFFRLWTGAFLGFVFAVVWQWSMEWRFCAALASALFAMWGLALFARILYGRDG